MHKGFAEASHIPADTSPVIFPKPQAYGAVRTDVLAQLKEPSEHVAERMIRARPLLFVAGTIAILAREGGSRASICHSDAPECRDALGGTRKFNTRQQDIPLVVPSPTCSRTSLGEGQVELFRGIVFPGWISVQLPNMTVQGKGFHGPPHRSCFDAQLPAGDSLSETRLRSTPLAAHVQAKHRASCFFFILP